MKLGELVQKKNTGLQTISSEDTVHEAVKKLCAFNIGALPVEDSSAKVVGIISERDVLRLCARESCEAGLSHKIADVMTTNLVIGVPDDDVTYAMRVMTEKKIRHLPIMDNGHMVSIITLGDLVKAQSEVRETEVRFLRDYVAGATA